MSWTNMISRKLFNDGLFLHICKPKNNTEVNNMDYSKRRERPSERYRRLYPKGTRILLIEMGYDPRPIPPNTRGTVDFVDDAATIHCIFDNGRRLGLLIDADNFRKLTEEEIEEENKSICSEETVEEDINDDQDNDFIQSM